MQPRRLLPALTALAFACVAATVVLVVAGSGGGSGADSPPRTAIAPAATSRAARILAAWDERRAAAWAEGDAAVLRNLYVVGSRTGAADVGLLRHYLARGLTVDDLRTQVLALDAVTRSPDRLVVVVTDRVVGGRAVGGASPVALPADRASTRRIVLVRVGRDWLVAEARDQASAAARTSWTSSSSKS